MAKLMGTKKVWQSFNNLSEKENQILKNSGYITIHMVSFTYASKDDFLQRIFSGKDRIALSSSVTYGADKDAVESTAVQDVTSVRSGKSYLLGKERILAEKIPANANSLSVNIKLTAVKSDMLQAKFDMLNKPEYQSGLKLLPGVVGQVLTITSLVRGLLADSSDQPQLEADFAGVIGQDPEDQPVGKGRLTQGLLFMISSDEEINFAEASGKDFRLIDNQLYYKEKSILNTNIVLRISFDKNKGEDQQASWSVKYRGAISSLDKLQLMPEKTEADKIKKDAINMWIEGNALLDADPTYINAEKLKIKATALTAINDTFKLAQQNESSLKEVSAKPLFSSYIITGFAGADIDPHVVTNALPAAGGVLFHQKGKKITVKDSQFTSKSDFSAQDLLLKSLAEDSGHYLETMGMKDSGFKF